MSVVIATRATNAVSRTKPSWKVAALRIDSSPSSARMVTSAMKPIAPTTSVP